MAKLSNTLVDGQLSVSKDILAKNLRLSDLTANMILTSGSDKTITSSYSVSTSLTNSSSSIPTSSVVYSLNTKIEKKQDKLTIGNGLDLNKTTTTSTLSSLTVGSSITVDSNTPSTDTSDNAQLPEFEYMGYYTEDQVTTQDIAEAYNRGDDPYVNLVFQRVGGGPISEYDYLEFCLRKKSTYKNKGHYHYSGGPVVRDQVWKLRRQGDPISLSSYAGSSSKYITVKLYISNFEKITRYNYGDYYYRISRHNDELQQGAKRTHSSSRTIRLVYNYKPDIGESFGNII